MVVKDKDTGIKFSYPCKRKVNKTVGNKALKQIKELIK